MKEPTQQYSDTIKLLQARLQAFEDENRLLRERLDEAGVSYSDIVSGDDERVVELYDPDQGARIKKFDVTDKIASDFFMMFCRGRKDVYDLRYTNPKTGKNGYYTQCFNRWDRGCHIQKKDEALRRYHIAKRILFEEKKIDKVDVSEWQSEVASLQDSYQEEYDKYKELSWETKSLRDIHKYIDNAIRSTHPRRKEEPTR